MGDVVARATEPALAAIKLAWWRERLEELDEGKVPAEPRLQAAADALLPRDIRGAMLARLESGWAGMLEYPLSGEAIAERGTHLFRLASHLLDAEFEDESIGVAGRMFAGADAARRGMLDLVAGSPGAGFPRIPRRARALTGLAALAARDLRRGGPPFEPEATPGRALTLLRHRLTGRLA